MYIHTHTHMPYIHTGVSISANAAHCAYMPPLPIPHTPFECSRTSPLPDKVKETSLYVCMYVCIGQRNISVCMYVCVCAYSVRMLKGVTIAR